MFMCVCVSECVCVLAVSVTTDLKQFIHGFLG